MKYLDPTHATDAAQQPIKNGTLQFLQDSHKENLANLIQGLIGAGYNPATIYRLWGCVISNLTSINVPYSCSVGAGAYFYNGEVYYSNSASCFVNTGQSLLLAMRTTQYAPTIGILQADPVTFTNGIPYNVHNIRTLEVISGTTGGVGVQGYVDSFFNAQDINVLIPRTFVSGSGIASVTESFPNVNVNVAPLALTTTGALTHSGTWPNISLDVPVIGTSWQSGAPTVLAYSGDTLTISGDNHLSWIIIPAQQTPNQTMIVNWKFIANRTTVVSDFKLILPLSAKVGPDCIVTSIGYTNGSTRYFSVNTATPGDNFIRLSNIDSFGGIEFWGQMTLQIQY